MNIYIFNYIFPTVIYGSSTCTLTILIPEIISYRPLVTSTILKNSALQK